MIIKVTESHIERGRMCNCLLCPLALAFLEATREAWTVGPNGATRIRDGWHFRYPAWLSAWISDYDNCEVMQPIEIEVPALGGVGA